MAEYKNEKGELHREDGPAVEDADGARVWWVNGKLHREDGPAVERADGSKMWWIKGNLHREDGPAVEKADGSKMWWIKGEELTKKEIDLAKKILSGKMFKKLPLYVNHPKLKLLVIRVMGSMVCD